MAAQADSFSYIGPGYRLSWPREACRIDSAYFVALFGSISQEALVALAYRFNQWSDLKMAYNHLVSQECQFLMAVHENCGEFQRCAGRLRPRHQSSHYLYFSQDEMTQGTGVRAARRVRAISACSPSGYRRTRSSYNCFACVALCCRAATLGRLEQFLRLVPAAGG